ncbi:mediator of RNA polymerase II transcription subunit 25-like isoform X2 [Leptidea sinapis]|uniref:mediator of RNA polymerase II transcription subunit 25-like isoform X2 n=1 Tax=Leptidea sinapis TaxID=189913 RepID=UPI002124E554|nr:mediator of RNA polymerase II transcription subunit 25-like isoform X2 [Leptidea sinapis]
MVVNTPDSPITAEVIFVIEATAANSAYIGELKTNYIVPTLEYFHGGALEDGVGSGSVYGIVTYQSADCHPSLPIATWGPFTCPQDVVDTVDKIQYIGGHAESRACITEALTAALSCLEELGRSDVPLHVILLCCSPPYSAYAGGLVPPGAPATVEQAARLVGERGVKLSVAAARRIPGLVALYEHAGGELHTAQQRNYAKDPRHLVLLRGYSLKERPPSPAPPPVPDIQTDVYGQGRGAVSVAAPRVPPAPFPRAPGVSAVGAVAGVAGGVRNTWLTPQRQTLYANNSALLTQLAQPSYPPPAQPNMQRMPMIQPGPSNAGVSGVTSGPSVSNVGGNVGTVPNVGQMQRTFIWSGVLEWMEKGKTTGEQQKVTKHLPCQVSANSKDIEPELKVDTWPNKLLMQLMPKQLISNIGGQYLKDSKSVLFHLQQNEALEALTKVMVNGFAGCVHFSPMASPPQCDIKVLILLYTPDKKAYLGFIPNNQATFVDRLRKVIQQQKISKQLPAPVSAANIPPSNMQPSGAGGIAMGMNPGLSSQQHQQHPQHAQNMMMSGMGGQVAQVSQVGQGGKGPRPVSQLDGLEAARQQNLEKIQHLQQTLEAAHQQEAQFKSQMDIMSHLHVAQQQEQHYKQLEEQRKHQLQQMQQLRGAGVGVGVGVGVGNAHQPRIMRPMMPTNPGLRHLLQQQQQAPRGPRPHM